MDRVRREIPFPVAFFLVWACQLPLWLIGGLVWGLAMAFLFGWHLIGALINGFAWGVEMQIIVAPLLATGMAWRRSATITVRDPATFRQAIDKLCRELRLIVIAESPDEFVLAPKWVLIRFRLQEAVVSLGDGVAKVTASAFFVSRLRKQLEKTLAAASVKRPPSPAGTSP